MIPAMRVEEFMELHYHFHLKTSYTRHEAYQKAEADHFAKYGKNKYKDYRSFSCARIQYQYKHNSYIQEPGLDLTETEADITVFCKEYISRINPIYKYEYAYERAEDWHIEKYGRRRFANYVSFRSAYSRNHQKKAA